jgi:hypothetical protein
MKANNTLNANIITKTIVKQKVSDCAFFLSEQQFQYQRVLRNAFERFLFLKTCFFHDSNYSFF